MIHEERLCLACQLPITNMINAVMVPDNGANQVYHRPCLEAMVGETPTPEIPRASVRMLPSRPRRDSDYIRIQPSVRGEDGKMHIPGEVSRKADSSQPMYSTDQCFLCRRAVSGEDIVRSGGHVGHKTCVKVLLDFINEPGPPKPPQESRPVLKGGGGDVAYLKASAGDEEFLQERLARQNSRFLVNVIADMIRESGY